MAANGDVTTQELLQIKDNVQQRCSSYQMPLVDFVAKIYAKIFSAVLQKMDVKTIPPSFVKCMIIAHHSTKSPSTEKLFHYTVIKLTDFSLFIHFEINCKFDEW